MCNAFAATAHDAARPVRTKLHAEVTVHSVYLNVSLEICWMSYLHHFLCKFLNFLQQKNNHRHAPPPTKKGFFLNENRPEFPKTMICALTFNLLYFESFKIYSASFHCSVTTHSCFYKKQKFKNSKHTIYTRNGPDNHQARRLFNKANLFHVVRYSVGMLQTKCVI